MKNAFLFLGVLMCLSLELHAGFESTTNNFSNQLIIAPFSQQSTFPDRDNDGIKDSEDDCPDTYGLKQFNGCPDTDGDGIMDSEDQCPTLKGEKGNTGCPEMNQAEQNVLSSAIQEIQFESGKSLLKRSSHAVLDRVYQIIAENPSYQLIVEGHTDGAGDDEMNMKLSLERAEKVKAYLIDKGISSDRLTAKGFGESRPIADNQSAEGRAINRRVELKVQMQ